MPSFEIQAHIFTRFPYLTRLKARQILSRLKNVSLYFKGRYLIIYKYQLGSDPQRIKGYSTVTVHFSVSSGISSSTVKTSKSFPLANGNIDPKQIKTWSSLCLPLGNMCCYEGWYVNTSSIKCSGNDKPKISFCGCLHYKGPYKSEV